jgi:[ribosomal protein S18]-alanine N-acetyltransferase
MTPGLTIREAGLAEVTAIWAIERVSFPSPWSRWSFLTELGQRHSRTLVIGPSPPPRQTWGYIIFWVVADETHIINLAVHPHHRRQGLARQLLQEALRQARLLGALTAWLEVRPSNTPARALYASLGFKEMGRRPRYYEDTQEDALLLALSWEEEGKRDG